MTWLTGQLAIDVVDDLVSDVGNGVVQTVAV